MVGLRRTGTLAGAVGAGGLAYATLVERSWYRLRRDRLPGALRSSGVSLRLLHVSDTHFVPPGRRLAAFVRSLADLPVQLVVATGDLAGGEGTEDATVELLASLVADGTPGVAVLGSSDLYAPVWKSPHHYFDASDRRLVGAALDVERLRRGLRETGWVVLENQRTTVVTTRGRVDVAGLRDPHLPEFQAPPAAVIAPRADDAVLRLGLVHAPYIHALDLLAGCGYEVVLAGHTHGGQVRLPPLGALTTNCDLPTARARGSSRWTAPGGQLAWLHVSAGLGQSRYAPVRFACRPEASLLELTG